MNIKEFIECAEVAFSDLKIKGTQKQIEGVAEYFEQQVENGFDSRGETSFYGNNSESCKCESLKERIKELENIISIHEKSVKYRRNCDKVWVNTQRETVNYE